MGAQPPRVLLPGPVDHRDLVLPGLTTPIPLGTPTPPGALLGSPLAQLGLMGLRRRGTRQPGRQVQKHLSAAKLLPGPAHTLGVGGQSDGSLPPSGSRVSEEWCRARGGSVLSLLGEGHSFLAHLRAPLPGLQEVAQPFPVCRTHMPGPCSPADHGPCHLLQPWSQEWSRPPWSTSRCHAKCLPCCLPCPGLHRTGLHSFIHQRFPSPTEGQRLCGSGEGGR